MSEPTPREALSTIDEVMYQLRLDVEHLTGPDTDHEAIQQQFMIAKAHIAHIIHAEVLAVLDEVERANQTSLGVTPIIEELKQRYGGKEQE